MSDALGCSAGCKRTVADMAEASSAGWELLPISQRWRCPDCTRELWAVSPLARCATCRGVIPSAASAHNGLDPESFCRCCP